MDFSRRDLEKLRVIAESNPDLRKTLEMYEQLTALGGPAARQQEENDRRWRMMVDAEEKMAEAEKPRTMGAFRDLLKRFGFRLTTDVPKRDENKEGHFGDFMEAYGSGGMELMSDFEMKHANVPKPRCDECKKESKMRCKQCGEHYCSRECQLKAWPSHKKVCKLVAAQRL
ncbi:hypothetical protein M758_7G179000 [Ceratodon purpureus]|uniref:MYND-type domain-containing protein n=1 Tax=Ceratodon purpureus TaxID=3225 RepID=A0A8T0HBI5_CERPU|nr:hypothetical protein KC19_7G181500 [Ceratodon purpureus]KAG0611949.1 hypothetical protein M758_7G179000 [Ceratodon purpureus]